MFSIYKHSILQDKSCSINPRIINRCVDRALEKPVNSFFDKEPPFNRLCSEQPHIPVENVDVVRREQAFGRWALPKLYLQLHSKDPIIQLQAINTLHDMLHDPEKAYEAIKLKFVPRLGHLLLGKKLSNEFKERILLVLNEIASHALGREEIMNRQILVDGFKDLMGHHDVDIRCKVAAVVEMLSRSFIVACSLLEQNYIPVLLSYVTTDEIQVVIYHLKTLEKLCTHASGQEEAIEHNGIQKLIFLLRCIEPRVVSLASNCLALLISLRKGKEMAVDNDLLYLLRSLLLKDDQQIYTSAAEVLMFATHTVESKHMAANVPGLAERLVELTNYFNHPPVQMFAMKALGNLVEHPDVRRKMLHSFLDDLKNIRTCGNPELRHYKQILLDLVNWKPWFC